MKLKLHMLRANVRVVLFAVALLILIQIAAPSHFAQRSEYRAFWVDTFNTALNNHADVLAVINNAKAANANAIFVQVRRRGDSWYLNSLEPLPDFVPIATGFDPLADLINEAHKPENGLEVHAFVIMSAVWSKNPMFAPSPTLGPPISNDHVFNKHGWSKATNSMRTGTDNWLTRSIAPFPSGVTFDGQRFGSDFWLDFGHPDAAAYSVDVLMEIVRNYDIDGLHLDRIRYPEFTVPAGQPALTPANGANIGYNQVSVARFNSRHGRTGTPLQSDAHWKQWRRDQVTNLVRRVYLNAVAIKPHVKVSAALIATGNGPVCNPGANCRSIWESSIRAEAYWRMYQDWRAWTEEGILDIAIPMNYKREHVLTPSSQALMFDEWNEWTKNHRFDRSVMIGIGNFINSVEGNVRQVRRALAPSAQGNSGDGVNFFSMATSNVAVTANPWSVPPGANTPARSFTDFALSLTTGKSATLFEPDANDSAYQAIFSQPAIIPVHPWKAGPTKGHLMGFARRDDNSILDTATVTFTNLDTNSSRTSATDGNGFYGGVDLEPGHYLVKAELGQDRVYSCVASVSAGSVTTANLAPETTAPVTTPTLSPAAPNGINGWYTSDITFSLGASDNCTGVASTEYTVNGGQTWLPYGGSIVVSTEGTTSIQFRSTDRAGNVEAVQTVTIKLDKTAPVFTLFANPSSVWPPDGRSVAVRLRGQASDAVSELLQVSYIVTDEYGSSLSVPIRTLSGSNGSWIDTLNVIASRLGDDLDGRLYSVTATVSDAAGNTSASTVNVVVPHDHRP